MIKNLNFIKKFDKCDMCGDMKEIKCLDDKELKLSLNVCEDCIEYAFESVGFPKKKND